MKGANETILVGIGVCARTAIEKSLPKRKGKEKKRRELQREFFTSMSYSDRVAKKLIFFEPFPLLATHRIVVTKADLDDISQQLSGIPAIDLSPSNVSLDSPPGKVKTCQVKRRESFDEDTASKETIDAEVIILLSGSPFEMTDFAKWSAGSIGSNGVISEAIEKDLYKRMKFANANAKPFAGKRLLEDLVQTNKSPFLLLLLSLELCEYDRTNGMKYLLDYIAHIKAERQPIHPWSLIAYARLNDNAAKPLFRAFCLLYPDAADQYLSLEELDLVGEAEDEATSNSVKEVSLEMKWEKLQELNPKETQSEAMQKLLKMTGLKKVKEAALKIYSSALQLTRMNPETRRRNMMAANYCFLGNPGTGKTTVARLFAEVLHDASLRKKKTIVETTAQQVKDDGMDEFRKLISQAKDGVLFIDEAYDLDPVGDYKGKPIVNELLTLTENNRDSISVILAGYEDDFNKKLFAYNDGLRSRFESIIFEDFDEAELTTIWNGMREDKCWKENPGVCRVTISRLEKSSGRKGLGNAREVRKVLERSIQSAMVRLGEDLDEGTMILDIIDVIGEDPRRCKKLESVLSEIEGKIGWKRIKAKIQELINLCGANRDRELKGEPQHEIFLNRMFLGNPGTGKTTCAKLYGKLLKHLGFLSIGEVVVKTAGDFVGSVVGESQKNTIAIIEGARGKVLLIDEAYNLDDNMYGKQVLDTLVEKVQNTSSDDIAVVLIGYEEQMLNMIRNQNPGLARRFPKDYAFYFDDYDENELLKIMQSYLKRNKVTASVEFLQCAMEILESQRRQANFGNAGSVELLVKGAIQKASLRSVGSRGSTQLEEYDLDRLGSARASIEGDPLDLLDKLYRMDKVKSKIEKLRDSFLVAKREGGDIPPLGHFVFTGNPGTGKTTVARVMSDVLYNLELIPSNVIQETTGLDLTGDFVGQTKTKVNEILRQAKGGVLFIDEAYNLAFGPYGKEACDTIVAAMTSEEFKDVVIIIAGYAADIDKMLHSNAGLKSRFNHYMEFPDWDATNCVEFFMKKATSENYIVSEDVKELLDLGFTRLLRLDGWGNGRDVVALWKDSLNERASRVVKVPETEKTIQVEDVSSALKEMIQARKPKTGESLAGRGVSLDMQVDQRSADPPDRPIVQTTTEIRTAEEIDQEEDDSEERHYAEITRDDGVSDEDWAELEKAKAKEAFLRAQCEEFERIQREKEQAEVQARMDFERKLDEIKRQLEAEKRAEALRKAHEAEERRKEAERLDKQRREREEQKRQEMIRQAERIKEKLRQISPCPAGFQWYKCGGGWRCGGGSHFVSDAQLNTQFTFDI
uniref:AAA+ ATPase domain-containing protein n=2 Tax=Leptocylindrus danicus TaxID=163516 RepID=A0A7S2JRL8_9STRA|mmetsp:Transcript_10396/g.15617  ORF Transcript_10396/g.15617 Transcript_10396/m.15617 type:complete len:1314 (+) Transcript_10396:5788-9729(+)